MIKLPVRIEGSSIYAADGDLVACYMRDYVAKYIAGLINNQGWITVGERCPDTDEPVQVTTQFGAVTESSYREGEWHGHEVTAWRPMPEPYKQEGNNESLTRNIL